MPAQVDSHEFQYQIERGGGEGKGHIIVIESVRLIFNNFYNY